MMMTPFNIRNLLVPIISAPIGEYVTVDLVTQVRKAGGMGSFAFGMVPPEKIIDDIRQTRQMHSEGGPVNANLFCLPPEPASVSKQQEEVALRFLRTIEPSIADKIVPLPDSIPLPNLEAQLESVWEVRPEVLTFHFGLPKASVIEKAHSLGIAVGVTATSVEEAKQIVKQGADFVVVQGYEAGGHRGTFIADSKLPTCDLVKQVRDAIGDDVPIAAAGGIMNGADIRAVLDSGADAAWMGTAFLTVAEAKQSAEHLQIIKDNVEKASKGNEVKAQPTVVTSCFTGLPARVIQNQFASTMIKSGSDTVVLPFPHQFYATAPFRAIDGRKQDFYPLLTGKGFTRCRFVTVEELMKKLLEELEAASTNTNAKSEL